MDFAVKSPERVWNQDFEIACISSHAILAHPHFDLARTRFLRAILELYGKDVFLNKLLMEAARTVVFGIITVLSASFAPEDRDTWPTLANVKRLTAPFSQSSPRRIEHIVQRLLSVGYLEQVPAPDDKRAKLLVPTDSFLAHDQHWLNAFYQPLDDLLPTGEYARPLAGDRDFQVAQRRASLAFIPHSAAVLMRNPHILLFATRDAGFLILAQIVLDLQNSTTSTYEQLARRFGVSRTHVRQLLQDAANLDLLTLSGRGGHVLELKPAGWACLDRFIADGMSNHDLTGGLALRALGHKDR